MPETVRLRAAEIADAPALAALKLACFRETFLDGFGIPYPPEDLARFEAENYGEQQVIAEIEDARHATWLYEDASGALLGYAHVGPCKLPHPDVTVSSGELYQLYVRKSAQGLGLGKRLMAVALEWLDAQYPGALWLGVWSGNERAKTFYAAQGFHKVGDYHFLVGNHRDAEFILRRD